MIQDRVPQWAKPTIETYLKTKQFPGQEASPLEPKDAVEMGTNISLTMIGVMAADNDPSKDSNPKPGVIDSHDGFFGATHAEFEAKSQTEVEGFATLAGGEVCIFARTGVESTDVVLLAKNGSADQGAIHIDNQNPNGSFMTFEREQVNGFLG